MRNVILPGSADYIDYEYGRPDNPEFVVTAIDYSQEKLWYRFKNGGSIRVVSAWFLDHDARSSGWVQ